ncbi:MAG TPA: SRPBCC domain-containing protein [Candidatus Cybelea sp.]
MSAAQAKHELQLATRDREIVMTRVFEAPRALVFAAFTKPELLQRWLLGPEGWSMPICEVDLRVGGTFHYIWRNDAGGQEFGLHGIYRAVVPNERIVDVSNFDQPWYPGDATTVTTFF